MADTTDENNIYNDPQTIGDTDDNVSGQPDILPPSDDSDSSESIYNPEKNTTELDDRGPIDELEAATSSDAQELEERDPNVDPALLDQDPTNFDADSYSPNIENADEQDGTER